MSLSNDKAVELLWDLAVVEKNKKAFSEAVIKLILIINAPNQTRRYEYAITALGGLCSSAHVKPGAETYGPYIAALAFEVADAMLAEEAKPR